MISKNNRIFFVVFCMLLFEASEQLYAQQTTGLDARIDKSLTAIKLEPISFAAYQERNLFSYNTTISYGLGAYYSFYKNTFPPFLGSRFIAERNNLFGRDYTTSGITPYILLGLRKYINLDKRIRLDKNVKNKAGSYFTLLLEYPLVNRAIDEEIDNLESAVPLSLVFGIRRSLGDHFFFEVEGGLVYKKSVNVAEIVPRLNASLNFKLK